MILRVPDYYREFSCIASKCQDSCCAGWEIDIDEESYEYYRTVEHPFAPRLRESMYVSKDGDFCFKLKEKKRCAMLNDDNLCDLYTALGEEALCETCAEFPRFSIPYGEVEQKGLSLSCEEAGRLLFSREEPVTLVDIPLPGDCGDGEEDPVYVAFMERVQTEAAALLQDRTHTVSQRMRAFLLWCSRAQDVINRAQARDDASVLGELGFGAADSGRWDETEAGRLSYADFLDRFWVFSEMEEVNEEWVGVKKEMEALFTEETYAPLLQQYLSSPDCSALGYEQLLVYFLHRYLMNAVYDLDLLSYAKLVVVSALVVRDMDAARFHKNGGHFTRADRISVARIFSKEVEHSEGNADSLRELCMMEEIAHIDALLRQIF